MFKVYEAIMGASGPFLKNMLEKRCRNGKEDRNRLPERMGQASRFRPKGRLLWLHAASVGEAQSALVLIEALLSRHPAAHVLVTTGTVSSAALLNQRLPQRTIHQFYPLDHPEWVRAFLDHWLPDCVLWMESELWPLMVSEIQKRHIPAALVNARLSGQSFRRWKLTGRTISHLLEAFTPILAQTAEDGAHLQALGAKNVIATGNLKYSAAPLPCDQNALAALKTAIGQRPLWLYSSTHAGEEELACRLHKQIQARIPNLLTVIAPRHPERRDDILKVVTEAGLKGKLRSQAPAPSAEDEIYIADTMGELGLFYRLCPLACIGRSFSADGGGGHNPIEPAQLGCAVLHGPHVQNLARIFTDMDTAGAALLLADEENFRQQLERLLQNRADLSTLQQKALDFAKERERVLDAVLTHIEPLLARLDPPGTRACA